MTTIAERLRTGKGATRLLLLALLGVLALTMAELVNGSEGITGRGTASAALRLAIPILPPMDPRHTTEAADPRVSSKGARPSAGPRQVR